nr:Chain C, LPEP peptide from EBV, P4A, LPEALPQGQLTAY [synthetic construct]
LPEALPQGQLTAY